MKEQCGADKYHHSQRSNFWKDLKRALGCDNNAPIAKSDVWNVIRNANMPKKGHR
jgi:hypothetical protein